MGRQHPLTMAIPRLVTALALIQSIVGEADFPVFAWTKQPDILAGFEPESAENLLRAKHRAADGSIVFLHSLSTTELAADQQITKRMQQSIESAGSSLFRAFDSAAGDSSELLASVSNYTVVPANEALKFLDTNPDYFKQGGHCVLAVDMRSMEASIGDLIAADDLRSQLSTHKATQEASLLHVLTTLKPPMGRKLLWVDTINIAGSGSPAQWSFFPRPTGTMYTLHPNGMLGLGVIFYLLFIGLCGFCCMLQLETPDMFEGDQKEEMKRLLGAEGTH